MQYIKAFNVYEGNAIESLMNGTLKLQSGQPIQCGKDSPLSVFDYTKPGYIRAYHGATYSEALAKYRYAKKINKMTRKELKEFFQRENNKTFSALNSK